MQTFRPKKKFQQGTLRYSLHKRAQASLNSAINLQEAVKLPPGENLNDWLAVNGKRPLFFLFTNTLFCIIQYTELNIGKRKEKEDVNSFLAITHFLVNNIGTVTAMNRCINNILMVWHFY